MRRSSLFVPALVLILTLLAPLQAIALEHTSLDEYRVHLEKLRVLVQNCEAQALACNASAVGKDEQVNLHGLGVGANADSFEANYDWLRDALKSAKNAGDKNRGNELQSARVRLDEAIREVSGGSSTQADFGVARQHADAILGHPEFATVQEDSIWELMLARFALWLDSLFNNVAKFGKRSPWIGPVMEWGLIGIALVGLTLWAMRALQRQRLAVRVEAARQLEPLEEAARNWRALAEEQAAHGDWREAVHCLYWASIAVLEGRRLWSPNRSRTPREYVRLLETGSTRWTLLRQQTQGFERIWYGLNEAAQRDYQRALELHEGLRAT
ncbi:MAG: DUF4129 domain-containing protein [Silvibacterium sp.]